MTPQPLERFVGGPLVLHLEPIYPWTDLPEAVTEYVMAMYVSAEAVTVKAASAADLDPLDDLRAGLQT